MSCAAGDVADNTCHNSYQVLIVHVGEEPTGNSLREITRQTEPYLRTIYYRSDPVCMIIITVGSYFFLRFISVYSQYRYYCIHMVDDSSTASMVLYCSI